MKKTHYDLKYFEDRDHLDLHIAESIKILMQDNDLKRVLDVGCGTGKLVKFLNDNGFQAYGSDNAHLAVKTAQKINKKNIIVKTPATKLPFKKNSFDILVAISMIEHLTKKEINAFILEVKRVLKSSGFIFIVTPNFASPWRFILGKKWFGYSDPTHISFFTPLSLSNLLKQHGFYKHRFWFKTNHPKYWKKLVYYFLFSTPFCFIRDSFWIAAQRS